MTKEEIAARVEKARALFGGQYNCSQAVAIAFQDVLGLKEEAILRVMSGFGYGMGGERSVCGAVSGGIFVVSSMIEDPAQREEIYDKVYYLIDKFKSQNEGKLSCIHLVGDNPTDEEFHGTCPLLIEQVVRAVAQIIDREH